MRSSISSAIRASAGTETAAAGKRSRIALSCSTGMLTAARMANTRPTVVTVESTPPAAAEPSRAGVLVARPRPSRRSWQCWTPNRKRTRQSEDRRTRRANVSKCVRQRRPSLTSSSNNTERTKASSLERAARSTVSAPQIPAARPRTLHGEAAEENRQHERDFGCKPRDRHCGSENTRSLSARLRPVTMRASAISNTREAP